MQIVKPEEMFNDFALFTFWDTLKYFAYHDAEKVKPFSSVQLGTAVS